MNAEERASEEVDVEIYEGDPDLKKPQAVDGVQDDGEDHDEVSIPEDIDAGEAVGSDLTPEIQPGSQEEAPSA